MTISNPRKLRARAAAVVCAFVALGISPAKQQQAVAFPQPVLISEEEESRIGTEAFAEIKRKSKLDLSAKSTGRVAGILKKLTSSPSARNRTWEFAVIVDKEPNAFALPGGKIGVHTGMLNFAKQDDELAAVLAHEIAHVTLRHGAKRISRLIIAAKVEREISDAASKAGIETKLSNDVRAALGLGGAVGVELPFSRTNEHEADAEGMRILKSAGYDPNAMVRMLVHLGKVSRNEQDWLSTHPSDDSRIKKASQVKP